MAATVILPSIPVVTIFVRHSADCRFKGEEFYKQCRCRKHLRWSYAGKQYRQSAKTRTWGVAEDVKRKVEEKFGAPEPGKALGPVTVTEEARTTIERAIEVFITSKRNSEVNEGVIKKYERELARLKEFFAKRSKVFPEEMTLEDLEEFRAEWKTLYPSIRTRKNVQTRLRGFLRYCYEHKWTEHLLKLSKIGGKKDDVREAVPFEDAEYAKILKVIPNEFTGEKAQKVRALIQLMRYSGLAIRDAVTLEREEIQHDTKKGIHRIVTKRQKTCTHVSVPIQPEVVKEVLAAQNGNPRYVFWNTGTGTEQTAVTNWQHDLRTVFRAAGLPEGHPHQLRHTFAVSLLREGVPLEEVSKLLGHDSIRTTEKHYAKWVKARQDRLDSLVMMTWKRASRKS